VVKADREIGPLDFLPASPTDHLDMVRVEDEMVPAERARRRIRDALDEIVDDIHRGKRIQVIGLKEAVTDITDSVLRNPDACMWLRMLKDKDTYTYFHLIDTSTLSIAFGRQLGFSRNELADVGLAALLIDIGKITLPKDLINKSGDLTREELALVRKHVDHSLELIAQVAGINKRITEVVAAHHERFDGLGYPRGLRGRAIPPFARMVAIADCFDAITSARPYANPMSPHEAMRKLYDWSDKDFQAELIEQFIQCLGIYPTGTLVDLSTGEVGIVISQNRKRRLKPRVMLVLDANKRRYESFAVIDLMELSQDDSQDPIVILRAVEPEKYGLDPREFHISNVRPDGPLRLTGLV
jgi:HD-GYP domain-containing protein (c-di-GMP phosphodiesterase class II)